MNQFFAVKAGTAYGDKVGGGTVTDFDDTLAEGAIGCFDQNGTLIPLANVLAGTVEKVTIALGSVTGENQKLSSCIDRDGTISYTKQVYVAPQKRVVEIGKNTATVGSFNVPVTFVAGDVVGLWIVDKTIPSYKGQLHTKYYEGVALVGDTSLVLTAQSAITRLIAKINADTNCPVIAAAIPVALDTLGITLTAKNFDHDFEVKAAGCIMNATYTALTAHIQSEGGYTQLLKVQKAASVEDGNRNSGNISDGFTQASMLVSGILYDQLTMQVINPEKRPFHMGNDLVLEIAIAIPTTLSAALTVPLESNIIANL